ncbi:MAG: AbrB/MazE/SpoVT family DNA-binding domain-containing protein [Elsteraceae bacterium]
MHHTNLRKVGGSVMLAVPPSILDILHLNAGATVGLTVNGGRLVIEPRRKPKYSLDQLLAMCDRAAPLSDEENTWLHGRPVGAELV